MIGAVIFNNENVILVEIEAHRQKEAKSKFYPWPL